MELFTISLIFLLLSSFPALTISYNPISPQDFLDPHNVARAEVGVQPLAWNVSLADYASNYARTHYNDCDMVHSGGPYGENLAEGYGTMSPKEAVELWISEKPSYNYETNSCVGGACLHYTQVVWRDTVDLGCARLLCRNGWFFVICSYYPPGNYVGERPY